MEYRDGLGHIHKVPDHAVPEFERRRGVLLRIAIVIKVVIIAGLLALSWSS